jgi:hypothetical protein
MRLTRTRTGGKRMPGFGLLADLLRYLRIRRM